MNVADLAQLTHQAMILLVVLVAPPVLASLTVGLLVAVFQTATQIQEQTVGFAARASAVLVSLFVAGPWIGAELRAFAFEVMTLVRHIEL